MRSTLLGVLASGALMAVALQGQRIEAIPVDGLTPAQQAAFSNGARMYLRFFSTAEGLGPVFNAQSCVVCHSFQADRAGTRLNTHFGVRQGDAFDPLTEHGGALIQVASIGRVTTSAGLHEFAGEVVPREANVTATRQTQPLQGLGFVDAVPDDTWVALAEHEYAADPSTAGRLHMVADPTSGTTAVGKFGWKAQVASLRQFAGDALLNEIGITNPGFPQEVCPQGDCRALAFNPRPSRNDDGTAVNALTDFMTMLAPPPRGTISRDASAGELIFTEIGCAQCHTPTIVTGPSAVAALDRVAFHPYSDFMLHDMGRLGDGIDQGQASGREMRTTPLWGLRTANRFLHDGSAPTITDAILRHDGQGRASRDRFALLLGPRRTQLLLAFLGSQ